MHSLPLLSASGSPTRIKAKDGCFNYENYLLDIGA